MAEAEREQRKLMSRLGQLQELQEQIKEKTKLKNEKVPLYPISKFPRRSRRGMSPRRRRSP